MLQQTQVERVIPKYQAFLERFPDTKSLAAATLQEIYVLWQGLGYNRRARFLQRTAQEIESAHSGRFPHSSAELLKLPGIGPYTASAICTFAYNEPVTLIETNVRTVFLYHFFAGEDAVTDAQLLPKITQELWQDNPREWYAALMDYGSVLKKLIPNPSRRSKHHTKQSRFDGSVRQVRGELLRLLSQGAMTRPELSTQLKSNAIHLETALTQLVKEKFLVEKDGRYEIA